MDKQQELEDILRKCRVSSINEISDEYLTALMLMTAYGEKDSVVLLLDSGADLEIRDSNEGRTALRFAVEFPQKDMVELLLERGADINAKDNSGVTPLAHAKERESVYRGTESGDCYAEIIKVLEAKMQEQQPQAQKKARPQGKRFQI